MQPNTELDRVDIPASLPYGHTGGSWRIKHGAAKLRRKYGEVPHSREFDAYAAASAARDPAWRNRVEMADLLMTWLMQSQIERRPGAIEAVLGRRREIEAVLAAVPDDIALEQDLPEWVGGKLEALFDAFRVKGVAVATMTKVLSLKRPKLIPMMDSHVFGFLFQHRWPLDGGRPVPTDGAAGVIGMRQFREAMRFGHNPTVLAALRNELNS